METRAMEMRQALKAHDFSIRRSKIGHIDCKFSKRCANPRVKVKIGDNIIPQIT